MKKQVLGTSGHRAGYLFAIYSSNTRLTMNGILPQAHPQFLIVTNAIPVVWQIDIQMHRQKVFTGSVEGLNTIAMLL